MGGSSWSDDHYRSLNDSKKAAGTPTFDYDAKVKRGVAPKKAHDLMDPKGVNRESRDSAAHPESLAIGVMFDVTGSMGTVPVKLQEKLPNLMGLLIRKNYVKDPQILFGAIGDFHSDHVPLQVGQFESGVEMDGDLTKIYIEGGGGGTYEESYQNALYFFANHTSIDCFEKRGKKGYLFLIGDEKPYELTKRDEIEQIFGDKVQGDLLVEEIIRTCQERYHVFFVIPRAGTSHGADPVLRNRWAQLLGEEHVIILQEASGVAEVIATAIGVSEGTIDLDGAKDHLASEGASGAVVDAVTKALGPLASKTALVKSGAGELPESPDTGANARV